MAQRYLENGMSNADFRKNINENFEEVYSHLADNASKLAVLERYALASVAGQAITVNIANGKELADRDFLWVEVASDITGGAITVNYNDTGALALKDIDGNAVTDLAKGLHQFQYRTGSPDFFVLAPKGGNIELKQGLRVTGTYASLSAYQESPVLVSITGKGILRYVGAVSNSIMGIKCSISIDGQPYQDLGPVDDKPISLIRYGVYEPVFVTFESSVDIKVVNVANAVANQIIINAFYNII